MKLQQSIEHVYESSQSELKKQALTRDDYQQQLLEHQEVLLKKNTASLQNMENRFVFDIFHMGNINNITLEKLPTI